jgi:hypothetical protein
MSSDDAFRERIGGPLKKEHQSIRDHKRFLTHFDILETLPSTCLSVNDDSSADGDGIV